MSLLSLRIYIYIYLTVHILDYVPFKDDTFDDTLKGRVMLKKSSTLAQHIQPGGWWWAKFCYEDRD